MKKIFSNNRVIAIAFFTIFSVASAPAVLANDSTFVTPVELKFIGSIKNQPLFQLSFAGNDQQDEFTINIIDEEGYSLYKENIKGENFSKKFLVYNDEIGDNTLRFEITCKKTKKTVVYEIDRNSRYFAETVLDELK